MSEYASMSNPRFRRQFNVAAAALVGLAALFGIGTSMAAPLDPAGVEADVPPILPEPQVDNPAADLGSVTPFDDHQDDQNLTFPDPDNVAPEAFEIGSPRDPFRQVVVPAPQRPAGGGNNGAANQPGAAGNNRPGAAGNNQPGATGNNQPGATGNNRPGAAGTNQPGAAGNNQPGAAGNNRPGTTGNTQPGSGANTGTGNGSSQTPPLAATGFEAGTSLVMALVSLLAGGIVLARTRR